MSFRTKLGQQLMALAAELPGLRAFKSEDLGQTYEERYGSMDECKPSSDYRKQKTYPSFSIYDRAQPLQIGDEGEARIKYRVTSRSLNERDGRKRHGYDIQVQSIDPMKGKKPKKGSGGIDIVPERAKLLDRKLPKLAGAASVAGVGAGAFALRHSMKAQEEARKRDKAKRAASRNFDDLRPGMIELSSGARGSDGQYADTDAGSITPNQVHAAYRTPPIGAPPVEGKGAGRGRLMRALKRMGGSAAL
jgi:hypothetical protein